MAVDPTNPGDGELNPALENTLGQFSDPQVQDITTGAAITLQQGLNVDSVAVANQAAGDQFVRNLAQTKDNLIGMVQANPMMTGTALNLAQQLISPLLHHANVDADEQPDVHAAINHEFANQIVGAAGTRAADFSPDMVQHIIDNYGEHLDDGEADKLTRYAGAMEGARQQDYSLGTQQAIADRQRGSQVSAWVVGQQLLDPKRETIGFPDDFMANLTRATNMMPADKVALYTAVNNLQANGDQPTDPYTFAQRLRDVVSPDTDVNHQDLMAHVGHDLSYVDAHMLQGLNLQATPAGNAAAQQLSDVVNSAQRHFAGMGHVGDAAFGRFVDWLLPSYRSVGTAGLDPGSNSYLFKSVSLAQFKPKHDDIVAPQQAQRSLGEIFGGSNA